MKQENCLVEIVEVFTVKETINDRGSLGNTVGSFFDKEQANKAAVGKGWYGGNGDISKEDVILITSSEGNQKAFLLNSKSEIDISHVMNEKSVEKLDLAMKKIQEMGLSKEEMSALLSQLEK